MTKEEIITGINNALVRGESLQKAMQSFVNAGYPMREVQEAAKEVNQGVTRAIQPDTPKSTEEKSKEEKTKDTKKKKFPIKIIILVIVLLVLVSALLGIFFFGK